MYNENNRGSHEDSPLMLGAIASSNGKPLCLDLGQLTLSEQVKLLERENERLQNLVDNLTEQLETASSTPDIRDNLIAAIAEDIEWWISNPTKISDRMQKIIKLYQQYLKRKEARNNGKTGD